MNQIPTNGSTTKSVAESFSCHVCGATQAREEFVSEVFTLGNRHVLVEHIPAEVCQRCGEPTFSRDTTERVRRLVSGDGLAEKTVPLEIFALV